jgi:NAD(P)-dependent dehydrogenase (short-subunit alcohol dehydrogenase family)
VLVNNAGHYGPVVPVEEYPLAEFDNVLSVHLRAAFLMTQLVLPEMYARGSGVILNISSMSAKVAFPWGSAYAAAKAGMLGLTRVTAAEAARKGVRVNALCPGPVTETRMSKDWAPCWLRNGRQPEGAIGGVPAAPCSKDAVKLRMRSRKPRCSCVPANRAPLPVKPSTLMEARPSADSLGPAGFVDLLRP